MHNLDHMKTYAVWFLGKISFKTTLKFTFSIGIYCSDRLKSQCSTGTLKIYLTHQSRSVPHLQAWDTSGPREFPQTGLMNICIPLSNCRLGVSPKCVSLGRNTRGVLKNTVTLLWLCFPLLFGLANFFPLAAACFSSRLSSVHQMIYKVPKKYTVNLFMPYIHFFTPCNLKMKT